MTDTKRQPTSDELAGMLWWNNLSPHERELELNRLPPGASVAEAWDHHKRHPGDSKRNHK